tara:strand:- start:288 stop:392 length:105 start_codon:yes stop_codon:yes gene_type:complete
MDKKEIKRNLEHLWLFHKKAVIAVVVVLVVAIIL